MVQKRALERELSILAPLKSRGNGFFIEQTHLFRWRIIYQLNMLHWAEICKITPRNLILAAKVKDNARKANVLFKIHFVLVCECSR